MQNNFCTHNDTWTNGMKFQAHHAMICFDASYPTRNISFVYKQTRVASILIVFSAYRCNLG